MKILFVWTGLTSYMADCWRNLAAAPGISLKVWIDGGGAAARETGFDAAALLRGLDAELVTAPPALASPPDVIFAVGWRSPLCRAVVADAALRSVPKVCCFDMPWRWRPRCLAAPFVLGRFLRRYAAAFVPGEACARYAKWLGFRRIRRGLFAIDVARFASVPPPSGGGYFLYLGRNAPEKRLDDVRTAYALYRRGGGTLPLRLCGRGLPDGFAAPEEVPSLLAGAAAVVLASAFDPWPLVLLEAMAAGTPVIASDRCTNRPELGRNWRVFRHGDVRALARAMADVRRDDGAVRGNRALAAEYDCAKWTARVLRLAREVTA